MPMKASIIPGEVAQSRAPAASTAPWTIKLGRSLLTQRLTGLAAGEICIVEQGMRRQFGVSGTGLRATVEVLNQHFWSDTAFGGSVGAGEAYINGYWRCNDLTALMRIMVANAAVLTDMEQGWAWLGAPFTRLLHFLSRNSKQGSRRNIAAHYDLGNDFFALFLDATMAYSCGIFETPNASMYEASIAKFERICTKLELRPTDHLLEIGTGWGGLAIHAARLHGCRVTTTTISRQQYDLAKEKIAAAGLCDRIELLLVDYRDLTGQFDKLVRFSGQLHPLCDGARRIHTTRDRYETARSRGHRPALCDYVATLAGGVLQSSARSEGAGLLGCIHSLVGVLLLLLRGGLRRKAAGRRADAAGEAGRQAGESALSQRLWNR